MDVQSGINSVYLQVLFLSFMFALHELEEWNILRWYRKHYKSLPKSTDMSVRIWIIFISILIFALTAIALVLIDNKFVFSFLIVGISAFMLTNIIQHVIWTIQYRDYSVGLSTAILLLAVITYVHFNLINARVINLWFYMLLSYTIVPIVKTMRSPHVMTPEIRGVHNLGIALERLLFKHSRW